MIGVGFWSLGGWGLWKVYQLSAPMRTLSNTFIMDLAAGNVDKAAAVLDTTVMSKAEIKSKFDEIVAFSGIEQFIDTQVKRYSSGMYVRLAFAVAAQVVLA